MTLKNRRSLMVLAFAALICVMGAFRYNLTSTDVPVTLQNLFVLLAACLIGPLQGSAATGIFLVLGILGLPVFSGFHGGIEYFTGQTGGYLTGYFIAAFLTGSIIGRPSLLIKTSILKLILSVISGMLVIYVFGLFRYMKFNSMDFSDISQAIDLCIIPFLPGDAIKTAVITALAKVLRPYFAKWFF